MTDDAKVVITNETTTNVVITNNEPVRVVKITTGTQGPRGEKGDRGDPGIGLPVTSTDGALPVWNTSLQKWEATLTLNKQLTDGGNF